MMIKLTARNQTTQVKVAGAI